MAQPSVITTYTSALATDASQVLSRSIGGVSWNAGDLIVITATSGGTEVYFSNPSGGGLSFTGYANGTHTTESPSSQANVVFYVAKATSAASNQTITQTIARWAAGIPWMFTLTVVRGARGVGNVAGLRGSTSGIISIPITGANSLVFHGFNDWNASNWATRNWYWTDFAGGQETTYSNMSGYDTESTSYWWWSTGAGTKQVGFNNTISGSRNTIGALEILPDNPPSAPTALTVTAKNQSQLSLSWTAATDDIGVASYNIYRGGTSVATGVTGTTWTDSGLTAGTNYSYTVSAVDTFGQEGPQSSSASKATLSPAALTFTGSGALGIAPGGTVSVVTSTNVTVTDTPTLVGASGINGGQTTTSATVKPTISSSAQAGDVAIVHIITQSGSTSCTTPTGWTKISGADTGSQTFESWVFGKTLVAGDAGTAVTFTLGTASRAVGTIGVFRHVDLTQVTLASVDQGSSNTKPTLPTLAGVPAGAALVGLFGQRVSASTAITVTPPSGYTEIAEADSAYTTSPNVTSEMNWTTASTAGTYGGVTGTASSSSGLGYLLSLPATTHVESQQTTTQQTLQPIAIGPVPMGLAGAGALAIQVPIHDFVGSVALSGAGTLGIVGHPAITNPNGLAFTGAGTLVYVGHPAEHGALMLVGSGSLALSNPSIAVHGGLTLGGGGDLEIQTIVSPILIFDRAHGWRHAPVWVWNGADWIMAMNMKVYGPDTPPPVTVAPIMEDTFGDPAVSATRWYLRGGAHAATVRNGQLLIVPNTAYDNDVQSVTKAGLIGSTVSIQLVQALNKGNGTTEQYFGVILDGTTDRLFFDLNAGTLTAWSWDAAGHHDLGSMPYDPATVQYLRLRESGGLVFFEYSVTGDSWKWLATATPAFDISSNLLIDLGCGFWGSEPSPGSTIWDNFVWLPTNRV